MTDLFDDVSADGPVTGSSGPRYTVTELTRSIKYLIEDNFPAVTVEGELSNYVHHSSGHRYFTLKDQNSQLRCVMFKWQAQGLGFEPEEGMKLLAVGNLTVYERSGQYQLNVSRLMPLGRGDLLARLEALKKQLAAEGLFANERPIPAYPRTIGVATSPTGAAVRDILNILERRAPQVRVIVRPTLVQGIGAAEDIERAIKELNDYGDIDVLIVGRGGGSIEDLWCFNEERVARAIAASGIPVISSVGHETDFTLADFAADLRAPTPSAAAELAVRDGAETYRLIGMYRQQLRNRMLGTLDDMTVRVKNVSKGLSHVRFMQYIQMKAQTIDEFSLRMRGVAMDAISSREKQLERLAGSLGAMSPKRVLKRGYAIVSRTNDHTIVTDPAMVHMDDSLEVEVAHGRFGVRVTGWQSSSKTKE